MEVRLTYVITVIMISFSIVTVMEYSGVDFENMGGMAAMKQGYNAEYVSGSYPLEMEVGKQYQVEMVMKNTGKHSWVTNPSGAIVNSKRKADRILLGFKKNGEINKLWGFGRVVLDREVKKGETYTFSFTVTAPGDVGEYNFQWKMLNEGKFWFGQPSPKETIIVVENNNPPEPVCTDHEDCDDENTCTADSCKEVASGQNFCRNLNYEDGTECTISQCPSDMPQCMMPDLLGVCNQGICVEPSEPDPTCEENPGFCDDGNSCTTDACSVVNGTLVCNNFDLPDGTQCSISQCPEGVINCEAPEFPGVCSSGDCIEAPEGTEITVLSYNIGPKANTSAFAVLDKVTDLIVREQPMIVSLQEVDQDATGVGNVPAKIALLLSQKGYPMDYEFTARSYSQPGIGYGGQPVGTFGQMVLSKYPILNFDWHGIYNPNNPNHEIVQTFKVNAQGFNFRIFNHHPFPTNSCPALGNLMNIVSDYPNDMILLMGDFNMKSSESCFTQTRTDFRNSCEESSDPSCALTVDRKVWLNDPNAQPPYGDAIDYVWLSKGAKSPYSTSWGVANVWSDHTMNNEVWVSDHTPVISNLIVPT